MGDPPAIMDLSPPPPKGLKFSNGQWVIDKQIAGQRIFKRTGTADLQDALELYSRELIQVTDARLERTWRSQVHAWLGDPASWVHRAHRRMRARGRTSGKGCGLSLDQVGLLLLRSNGRCELTGIRFSDERRLPARVAPYSASIDRIDSSRGYYADNCRVVCAAVNIALGAWGDGVLMRIGEAFVLARLLKSFDALRRPARREIV